MSGRQIFWERLDLISLTTLNGLLYGIALSLYILSARLFYPQLKHPHERRHVMFMFAYASMVMICGIIFLALTTWVVQLAYIDHNTSLGAAMEYEGTFLFSQPGGIAVKSFNITIDALTLGIQIWRLWVIYGATRYAIAVIILPLLLFLCYIALGVMTIVLGLDGTQVELLATQVTGTVSQLAIEIIVTVLIIGRLLVVRRRHINMMGVSENSKQYMGIVAMLIESYALESAWTLAALISQFLDNESAAVFLGNCDPPIEIIAYLLVIYRVSSGRGWNRQTERQISGLQFQVDRTTHSTTFEATMQNSQAPPGANIITSSLPQADSVV
ncbi:hypothetical protein P691DRAFT_778695 [Macrolepiota fuliginosa MF-IS2]|uniref:Uncharacterized protein n=1 Tax=Macrolepiota fuliginosa MF-IS2 TaxID=1400762 RepID=A0A9P5X5I1_9AGAR|nr:hypothetical protein P691DRAFT_778695 [Macrolepiota fuliginosa MF-IS2]